MYGQEVGLQFAQIQIPDNCVVVFFCFLMQLFAK